MNNLKTVLENLRSDKIKERQEGLSAVRTVFAQDKVVANFHINPNGEGDPRAWLPVFQALFQTVRTELEAMHKTSSKSTSSAANAERRLADAASVVRWLTDRSAHLLNKGVVRALFEHLLQTMVRRGKLIAPVALDYAKALRCLVTYTPHLEHMEDETWIEMAELAFNAIMNDPITTHFADDSVDGSSAGAVEADDLELYEEDDPMEVDDEVLPSTRKRGRKDSTPTQMPSSSKMKSQLGRNSKAPTRQVPVSLEQVEFMSLLSVLFRSPSSPLLSPDFPYLPSSILLRLQRFLDIYPPDTSLQHDYLLALSSTLSTLSLNKKHIVEKFAYASWDKLVRLWGTKNKRMKEGIIVVLRILFPFVISDNDLVDMNGTLFDCAESIARLWYLLNGEAESRWGVDCLSLDCLRLELATTECRSDEIAPFIANTFRSGWSFDEGQALAWAILELQADCASKLFFLSESMHPGTPSNTRSDGKRIRLENPVTALLASISGQSTTAVRVYHLQILLFFIDRHWLILHDTLQNDVIHMLLQFVSYDEGLIQSWVFLCFASIAYANSSGADRSLETLRSLTPASERLVPDPATWDSIWTNAIRRVNVPIVCRAACHAAHALLHSHSKATSAVRIPLSSQRVLLEIEALGKDLDVQGPAYPYDSVCAFLGQCMQVASQDMRLYRLHLEEKVLSWLVDSWKVVNMVRRMSLYLVKDIMLLLEGICGLTKRSDLVSRVSLPQCQITDMLTEQAKTKVIRDFLMDAQLPIFRRPTQVVKVSTAVGTESHDRSRTAKQLVQPRGRERKVSTFLLKSLEALLCDWEDSPVHVTAERARLSLDVAITALSFESALILNGTQANRRVVQCACKLVSIVSSLLADSRWTVGEKALILLGLDPLTSVGNEDNGGDGWDAMLPPDVGSGIKAHTLKRLTFGRENKDATLAAMRMDFLRIIWQNADVQDAFNTVTSTLRSVLRAMLGEESLVFPTSQTSAIDNDGFGPIRTTATRQSSDVSEDGDASYFSRIVLEVCIAFLTVGPALQSASGEPTRDKPLTELVLNCAELRPSVFLLVCPILFQKTRQGFVNLSVKNLDSFLDELSHVLRLYEYARSRRAQLLATQFLDSTLDTWASRQIVMGEILGKVRYFCGWLSGALRKQKIRDWFVRDFLARFLDRYLAKDPDQFAWSDEEEPKNLPDALLPMMSSDEDIRVRFRVAVINARLFAVARHMGRSALSLYDSIKHWYTVDLDNYERMITRMLSLGNIMVVSSAVRRGPYWHLLETCIHSPVYSRHIECILSGVSERMGLERFSVLFESYASQLAYSIRQADSDFLRFPPHILGYHDRKECAQSTFRSFTPTNIWNGGQKLFEGHCKVLQISIDNGLRECFGDIVGYQIVTWVDEHDGSTEAMEQFLKDKTFDGNEFEEHLEQNMDDIVAFILRTLGDQDFSDNGPIVNALRSVDNNDDRRPRTFQELARYRRMEDFDSHQPNLPAFPTETVLQALSWLHSRLSTIDAKATTYHVLHQLFAQVEQSPLINEQVRLINAISLWIACHHEEFKDATLLHTLIHGAASLLKQSDLARSAQSILEWAFDIYRRVRTKDSSFPNVLIRIACLAHDYAIDPLDNVTAGLGGDLLEWIDAQALKLSKVSELSSQILRVLPAWPHDPSPHLSKLSESVTVENLSAVLEDHRVSSNKFRLVRRLHNYASSNDYNEDKFAKSDFWRLKECMPPINQLQEADVDAFIAFIFLNKGRTNSFDSEIPNSGSLLSRHKRSLQKQSATPTKNTDKAQEAITLTLLTMLRGDSAQQSHVAYNTLRLIKSVPLEELAQYTLWPSEHQAELRYLEAYRRSPRTRSSRNMRELLTSESFSNSTTDFSRWIADVTILLSDILSEEDAFFAQLTSILQSTAGFAEQILPVLVYTVLQAEQARMEAQGESYRLLLSNYFTSVLSSDFASISCLRSIVNVVLHLRHFPLIQHDALSYNKWLNIDSTLLARSAIKYGAYTTALLFLELAKDNPKNANVNTVRTEEQTLYEIYRHIDEPDGFYGISDHDLHQFLIKRFHHEKQWDKAFQFHGAALEAGSTEASDAEGLVKSFHSFGFDSLAIDALQTSIVTETAHTPTTSYRLGWRTETWDLPDHDEGSSGSSLYVALRAIHRERDASSVDHIVTVAIANEMERLRSLGSENFAEIREVVQELLCLREVKQWRHESTERRLVSKGIDVKQWPELTEMNRDFDFSHLENIMATRISLLRSVRRNEERQQIGTLTTPFAQGLMDIEKGCLLRLSEAARNENQIQIALNSVIRAQRLEQSSSFAVLQEFSNVLWRQKEEQVAVQFLERLVSQGSNSSTNPTIGPAQKAVLLARLGTWSSEACLKNSTDIQDQYFQKATAVLNNMSSLDSSDSQGAQAIVYHECAIFADRQYRAIIHSPDAIRWKVYAERKQQEMDSRSQEISKSSTKARRLALEADQTRAKKLFDEDIELFRSHNSARDTFLKQAIDMYSHCLYASDSFDSDAAIRLCSLWFANFEEHGTTFQDDVQTALERIPSRKFIFLAHQLSARISKPQTGHTFKNQETLQNLVVRMCREHPFHSLYQVYCLKSGRISTSSTRRQSERHSPPTAQVEREDAALEIFDRLRTEPVSQARVLEVERLCDACIQWAQYPIAQNEVYKNKQRKSFPVPEGLLLLKISNMRVPVITHHLPLDHTMRYDDCAWVERYEPSFETAGGINLPKISVCYDNFGQRYKQLFKGNDDLRQDAVMEQVFDLVNNILRRDRETRRRNLAIRDYKVIPLGSQAGVLEFVGNTIPLSSWLRPAHARYHPHDMSFSDASNRMTKIREDAGKGHFKEPNKAIEEHFKEVIQKKFHPIMRHYFTEKHKTPISWFAKRLNYTRSVATTSIVGHILGLGDRHISNILLDNASGQVVHIDLGIAFDQGKYLKVPERVPFRMTRDMVDGMGSSGTKGVFQRCAEETLRVLREDSEVIMTVLEVFKHDPLHSWTASEVKVQRVQRGAPTDPTAAGTGRFGFGLGIDMSSGSAEEAADRALSSVARKLDKTLSVEYTVNQLVTAATSTANLSLIFPGWSPHC